MSSEDRHDMLWNYTRDEERYRLVRGGPVMDTSATLLGILDDDMEWLFRLREAYSRHGVSVECYKYPEQISVFLDRASMFSHILVDLHLGGPNGANITRSLLKSTKVTEDIVLMSSTIRDEKYNSFTHFINKAQIIADPMQIFGIRADLISQAVETSVLLQVGA